MTRYCRYFELPYLCLYFSGAFALVSHAVPMTSWLDDSLAAGTAQNIPALPPMSPELSARATLWVYCCGCHQSGRSGMDFTEDALNLDEMRRNRSDWEEVVRRVRSREMPPRRFPQPNAQEREELIAWIEREVIEKPIAASTGRLAARRLHRAEYIHTVRALLGVEFQPAPDFPKDDAGWTRCDETPALPPAMLMRYRAAAETLLDHAMAVEHDLQAAAPDEDCAVGPNSLGVGAQGHLFSTEDRDGDPTESARDTLEAFARRAFRGSIDPSETDRLLAVFQRAQTEHGSFATSMKTALMEAMTSPRFLYRVEPRGEEESRAGQFALASRLSFFLWSSTPDDELLDLAGQGRLLQNLEPQIKRLLRDPRAHAMTTNFASHWLSLDKMDVAINVPESLRRAMRRETELFIDAIRHEDRSVLDFIDADFTFANDLLAEHYGFDGIRGDHMRRIDVHGTQRGGLLGQASVLMVTSGPDRTSPVNRGKWVLETLLGAAPIRPPASVIQALQNTPPSLGVGSMRQQLAIHRSEPGCAQCHTKLDAIGFSLENFNPLGAWRTEEDGHPVEAIGTLADGSNLDGPKALKGYLFEHREEFVRALAEKMLSHSLERKLTDSDRAALVRAPAAVSADGYRFSRLVMEVVRSDAFRHGCGD